MDEIDNKRRNDRETMFNLFYEIQDLLSDLKEGNNDGSKHLKELKKSVKSTLTKFEKQLLIVKVEKGELESIKKLKAKVQEALA